MIPHHLYAYVWQTTRHGQTWICLITAIVAPMAMIPLELQRRIVDQALGHKDIAELLLLGVAYLVVVLVQGALKYSLNLLKGRTLEQVTRDIRGRILQRLNLNAPTGDDGGGTRPTPLDDGTVVSILAAEAEDVGGFASESLGVPLLQFGTIASVLGYLLWVEPLIAVLAVAIYLPQFILVPRIQHTINRLVRMRTTLVRRLGHHAVGHDEGVALGIDDRRRFARAKILIGQIFRTRLQIYYRKFFLTFLGNFLDALGPIVVLVLGGYLVIQGQTEVSTLVVFISGFQRLSDPWDTLINFYRTASNALVSYDLVAEALQR